MQRAKSERVTYRPGDILRETIEEIRGILGDSLESVTVERAVIGLFFTGVKLSNGAGGLCFTPVKAIPDAVCCPSSARTMPASGRLRGGKALQFLADTRGGSPLKKTVGIAVMNALSAACWKERPPRGYTIREGVDVLDEVELLGGGYTVVVGALVPIIRRLKQRAKPFGILELDPSTLKADEMRYYVPAERASEHVPKADTLIITGTTLINDTLEGLLEMRRPGARVTVVGPTASMLPEAFFMRGVDVLGGVVVSDADRVLEVICEAGSGYHFFGKGAERVAIEPQSHGRARMVRARGLRAE